MSRHFKQIRRAVLVPFEWVGIGVMLATVPWMSRRFLFGFCDLISGVFFRLDRRGRRRALENLRILLGAPRQFSAVRGFNPAKAPYDPTRREELVLRRSYRNMTRSVGYAFWTIRKAAVRCAETGIMDEATRAFLDAHRPAVTVSGHIGCWEILSQLAFLNGHRMMSVAKDIGTVGMTALLMHARRSIGQEIVSADGAFRVLLQGLRDGKSLGLLVDQNVSPRRGGIWVRFCGFPMAVSAAPAFFAAKGKVPIVIAWSRPLKGGRYRCEFVDAIAAEEARDVWVTTQRCARTLERIVRRHPSCWVLNYNLFKSRISPEDLAVLERREAALYGELG